VQFRSSCMGYLPIMVLPYHPSEVQIRIDGTYE
jgi:hypothetical protein